MKTIYLSSFLIFCSMLTRAQAYNSGNEDFIGIIIVLVIVIALFFALRGVFLWYWRVDTIVKNQYDQNKMLKAIYDSIEEQNSLIRSQIEISISKSEEERKI